MPPRPNPEERPEPGRGFLERWEDDALIGLVTRSALPPAFQRWHLVLAPGTDRATEASEWAGALVLVEQGRLEVDCATGGLHVFDAGDLLVLGWLPLRMLRNIGRVPVRLVAVRRRDDRPTTRLLRVIRHIRH